MLKLHTFGGLEVRTGAGEWLDPLAGRTKCLALLAYLAVEAPDGRVPREKVASLLWPDRINELSRASLRVALSQIRQATDADLVAGAGTSSVGLARDHLWTDVTAFREALEAGEERRALELYEGEFLAGVHVKGARQFQRWVDRKQGHLRQEAYEIALSVGAAARKAGDMAAAEDALRKALDLAPLREEAAQKLIRTLADRGRMADAVQLYEAFRQRRQAELGIAPSDELDEMVEELRRAPLPASGAGGEADASAVEPAERPSPAGAPRGREPPRWGRFRRRTLVSAIVAAGLLSVAVAGVWHLLDADDGAAAVAGGDRSVAVLPFKATGTEDPGPIAEGLHGDLLTRLSNVSGLEVISATSVERYRDSDLGLPAIAESLGVKWVVEGEVQRAGDAIQVNAQLVDPRIDTHAWAETYRRELTAGNLFDLQGDITRRIAGSLEAELTPGEWERVQRSPTHDLEAYRFYVQGRRHLRRRTATDAREAARYLRQAVERDSSFALAWTALADLVVLADRYGWDLPAASLPDPYEAAQRALQLDPDLAEAHATLGLLALNPEGEPDAPAAYRKLRRAVELKPSYAEGHFWLGYLQLAFNGLDRAVDHLRTAVDLDPEFYPAWGILAWAEFARGAPDEALSHIDRELAARRGVSEDNPAYAQGGRDRGIALYLQRRYPDVERIARPGFSEGEGLPVFGMLLVAVEAATGDTAGAERALAQMQETGAPPVLQGVAHAALGDVDGAFKAFSGDNLWPIGTVVMLRYWFPEILGPIRADPRYPELVRQIERRWKLKPDGSLGGLEEESR